MHKRQEGNPHKGWKAAARQRLRGSTSIIPFEAPAFAACKRLCECAACAPMTYTSPADRQRVASDDDLRAYLDTLPRAQWAHADVMLRAMHAVPKDRAVAVVKAWLREKLLAVPPKHGMSESVGPFPGWSGVQTAPAG